MKWQNSALGLKLKYGIFFPLIVVILLFTIVIVLVGVAFVIVTERKGLGMVQLRQGPNKVRVKGILQPIADGVKLFKKEF